MKRFVSLGLLFFICLPFAAHANVTASAGFVEGIWLSTNTPTAGTPVRIYVAVRNNTGSDITGLVTFYDNHHAIGSSTVAAVDGRIMESWTDWTPSAGSHTLTANLTHVEAHAIGAAPVPTTIANADATSTITVRPKPPTPKPKPTPSHPNRSTNPVPTNATPQPGLEQFVPSGTAHQILAAVTKLTNQAKQAIDTYQQTHAPTNPVMSTSSLDTMVNDSGFGTVTRSVSKTIHLSNSQTGGTLGGVSRALGAAAAVALGTVSFALGYPMLIELFILLGILWFLYRTARRYGRRRR